MHKLEFSAMGTQVLVAIDSDEPHIGKELEEVRGWFEEWEQALSRFRPDSELSLLNQSSGTPFQASPLLWEMLQLAFEGAQQSGGLVSPALLPALEQAGYQRSFQLMAAEPAGFSPVPAWFATDLDAIQLEPATRTVVLPPGMRLDFGGIAKGWAANQSMLRLHPFGAVLADVGGDIAVSIPEGETQGWEINVRNAYAPLEVVRTIRLTKGGVATSGRDRRRWQQGGREQHHIIDPRSGQPAETDVLAATVIANTAMEAEMAAKTVLILGSQQGLAWLAEREGCYGMVVLENGSVLFGRDFENF